MSNPQDMSAVTIDRFGGEEVLTLTRQPKPQVGPGQVLVKVAYAGVGTWDPLEREGGFVEFTGQTPTFPYILGTDGSGVIAEVGDGVTGFAVGDEVYALGHGFYAEYVALNADAVSLLPDNLPLDQAGAMPVVALTAWQGLVDELRITKGETLLINGASGDLGHIAVQLAKRLGAQVMALASGEDGVETARALGADIVIDGRKDDVVKAVQLFAPGGVDAVLTLVGGLDLSGGVVRTGGRVAYPLGVSPEPEGRSDLDVRRYDITTDAPATTKAKLEKLNALITSGPFEVRISNVFALQDAASAHAALGRHRVGKIILATGAL